MNAWKFRVFLILLAVSALACASRENSAASTVSDSVLRPFIDNAEAYVAERTRIGQELPKLSGNEEPQEIKDRQEKLRQAVVAERSQAREGDIFTKQAEPAIRSIVRSEFRGPDGPKTRLTVMEAKSGSFKCEVYAVYPEDRPVSTIPLALLSRLPKLPDDLEYRFVGPHLILRDGKINMIVDCVRDVIE